MNELNPPIHEFKKGTDRHKCPKCGSTHTYWDNYFKFNHCAGLSFSCGYFWRWDYKNNEEK